MLLLLLSLPMQSPDALDSLMGSRGVERLPEVLRFGAEASHGETQLVNVWKL